jgi:hypothetical protein
MPANKSTDRQLDWPLETAVAGRDGDAELDVPGSNLVLDLHGDPARAGLIVFSDGNHHMALEETLAAFVQREPDVRDIFYATTPPRVIAETLKSGRVRTGNLTLSLKPHIFISPGDVLDGLRAKGLVGPHEAVMKSRGLAILVRKGNPAGIDNPAELVTGKARLAISNPITEKASFGVYAEALRAFGKAEGIPDEKTDAFLLSDDVPKSRIIHHREIPQILANGEADASLIYFHLALRYTRIFPDRFDLVEVDISALENPERFVTAYHMALVGNGGTFGDKFAGFYRSAEAGEIYTRHGLQPFNPA